VSISASFLVLEDFRQSGGKLSLNARDNSFLYAANVTIRGIEYRKGIYILKRKVDLVQEEYVVYIQDSVWSSEHFQMTGIL
jgi:hypothetical protein